MSISLPFRPTDQTIVIAVKLFKTNNSTAINSYGKMDTWITTDVTNMEKLFHEYVFDVSNWN